MSIILVLSVAVVLQLFTTITPVASVTLITDQDQSVCAFSGNASSSGLIRSYTIITTNGDFCDAIAGDDNCASVFRSKGVIIGNCILTDRLNSHVSECLVNRSLIWNECCRQKNFEDCSLDKACSPFVGTSVNGPSTTYDSTPYATGTYPPGTVATFSCSQHLDLVGQNSSTCRNRTFHPIQPLCKTPIRIKFQSHTYEETDTPCLIVTNGTVFSPSGITIGLHLETSGNEVSEYLPLQEVHFSVGSSVGDHQCTAFPNTLKGGQYTVRAQVLSSPEDSPSITMTDSATLVIHIVKWGLRSWGMIISAFAVVITAAVALGSGVACCAARRHKMFNKGHALHGNTQHPRERPSNEPETILFRSHSVPEKGDCLPSSSTQRGSPGNVNQFGLTQLEVFKSFATEMRLREEDFAVCVELPVDDMPTIHGSTQAKNSSSTSKFVFPQRTYTKPLATWNQVLVHDESIHGKTS